MRTDLITEIDRNGMVQGWWLSALIAYPVCVTVLAACCYLLRLPGACMSGLVMALLMLAIGGAYAYKTRMLKPVLVILGFAAGLFFISRITMSTSTPDYRLCYDTLTLTLANGWNPVHEMSESTFTRIAGIESGDVSFLHVIGALKSVFYLEANLLWMFKNPFNLHTPCYLLFLSGVTCYVWRVLKSTNVASRLFALLVIGAVTGTPFMIVDAVVNLNFIGLLFVFYSYHHTGRLDVLPAFAFSFWLISAKAVGIIPCFMMWGVFLFLARQRLMCGIKNKRFACVLVLFLISVGCAFSSPFYSSYKSYGHALYPRLTAEPDRFPVRNVIGDFLVRNEDAAKMGRCLSFVNAYVSPTVARWCGRMIHGETFDPVVQMWKANNPSLDGRYPLSWTKRLYFALCVLAFVCLAPSRFKLFALPVVFATVVVPTECIGFVRYAPFISLLLPLIVILGLSRWSSRWTRGLPLCVLVANGSLLVAGFVLAAWNIDMARGIREFCLSERPKVLYNCWTADEAWNRRFSGYIKMVMMRIPTLRDAKVDSRVRVAGEKEQLDYFYDRSFFVNKVMLRPYSRWYALRAGGTGWKRCMSIPFFVVVVFSDLTRDIIHLRFLHPYWDVVVGIS